MSHTQTPPVVAPAVEDEEEIPTPAEAFAEAAADPVAAPPTARSLDRSLLMGIAWTGGIKWATQIVSWTSTIIIARLLSPADYGIMGMAMVYVNFVTLVNDFGLTAAILTKRDMTPHETAQVGGFGILVGMTFTLISIAMAWPVAWFYGDPAIHSVVMLLSVNFTLSAAAVLPRALMARDLEFSRLAWIDAASSFTQIGVTVVLALLGARYFSLVYSSIAANTIGLILALSWRGHRIAFPHPFASIKKSISVGWHLVVGRIAWYTYQNADFAIVGRVLGKVALGTYTLGWEVATIPVERVSALVGQVTPSIFASIQHDREALRRYFLGVVGGIALLTFPAAIGIAITANLFVPYVFGEKWIDAIPSLQLLAGYAGIRSIDTVAPQILVFTGHSRQSMWYSVWAACLLPFMFYIGTRWGPAGVAATWVVAYPVVMFRAYKLVFSVLDLTVKAYFANLWAAISSTTIMALVVLLARSSLQQALPDKIALLAEIVLGAVTYAAVLFVFHRQRMESFIRLVKHARQ